MGVFLLLSISTQNLGWESPFLQLAKDPSMDVLQ